jgi:hypothetical protein
MEYGGKDLFQLQMRVFESAKEKDGARARDAPVAPSMVRAFLRDILVMSVPARGRKGSVIQR